MTANVFEPHWDAEQDEPPFTWRRSRIGRQAGSEKLGASLYEVPPGASSFPLHVHYANEEMIVVLAGSLVLRSLDEEVRELGPGDVIACPVGPRGAHRLDTRGDEPARVLIVSTMNAPEVNDYPDSNKTWVRTYPPGATPGDDEYELVLSKDATVDYLDGERQ
jgi:uncharacterized cupin superfamily protein